MDVKQFSESTQAFYRLNKNLFCVQVLLRFGARTYAVKLGKKTLEDAEYYNLTEISLSLLFLMRAHYRLVGSLSMYNHYDKKLKLALDTLEAEYLAAEFYERLGISEEQPQLIKTSAEYSEILQQYCKKITSYEFVLYYNRFKINAHRISQNFEQVIESCDEFLNYLATKPHLTHTLRLGEFNLYKLLAQLHLRDYENGRLSAEQCRLLYNVGTNGWFTYMEYHFLLTMHTTHFDEAKILLNTVSRHPRFKVLPDFQQEKWRIFELYLNYALGMVSNTSVVRILKTSPIYAKDKRGNNVALLVWHILHLLGKHDYKGIINRMDALRTYRSRYLRLATNRQSALFFKLLLIMERCSFDYKQTLEKSKSTFEQLKSIVADYSEINEGLQVLPFDWLWERVLEQLKKNEELAKA